MVRKKSLNVIPILKFTYEFNKEKITFLDMKVSLKKFSTDVYLKPTDRRQYLYYLSPHPYHTKKSGYVVQRRILKITKRKGNCGSWKGST